MKESPYKRPRIKSSVWNRPEDLVTYVDAQASSRTLWGEPLLAWIIAEAPLDTLPRHLDYWGNALMVGWDAKTVGDWMIARYPDCIGKTASQSMAWDKAFCMLMRRCPELPTQAQCTQWLDTVLQAKEWTNAVEVLLELGARPNAPSHQPGLTLLQAEWQRSGWNMGGEAWDAAGADWAGRLADGRSLLHLVFEHDQAHSALTTAAVAWLLERLPNDYWHECDATGRSFLDLAEASVARWQGVTRDPSETLRCQRHFQAMRLAQSLEQATPAHVGDERKRLRL